jgi:hypothetical protein
LTSGRWPVVKIIDESISQHDEKHVIPHLVWEKDRKKRRSNKYGSVGTQYGRLVP